MNIMLVDDDQWNREIIAGVLRDLGHEVLECGNGKEALACFRNGRFHMVLSDLKMPHMSGLALLQAIKALPEGENTDVVLFTGYADVTSAIDALRSGAYDYILKPIHAEELIAITEKIADHQALLYQNKVLTENFAAEVDAATQEAREQLNQLKKVVAKSLGVGEVGVFSEAMEKVVELAQKYAEDRSIPVLIQGETGTGKEVIARIIHYGNLQGVSPFVDVNCAALMPSLFESELFGYEAGSFTGSQSRGHRGKFDLAEGGTLFLDEIGEIPPELQGKLLRVIQEKEYYRVGGLKKIKTDVRIICATNAELERKVEQGLFRRDLYYRLRVGFITIPPLRARRQDIIPMAKLFLENFSRERGKHFVKISREAEEILCAYDWPGNVRELKNQMEWIVFMYDGDTVLPRHLGLIQGGEKVPAVWPESDKPLDCNHFVLPPDTFDLDKHMQNIICKALELHNGNKSATANYLGISRKSLYRRLEHIDQ